jgi:CheY-like chemotaxis protein
MATEPDQLKPTTELPQRKMLGEIFVERGLLTETSVTRLIEHAKSRNMRLGSLLEIIGLVTQEELAEALAIQYRCRKLWQFANHRFAPELLRIIPMEMAVENTIFPLKLENGKMGLAVADPTMEALFARIAGAENVTVVPFVSTRTEINRAIARHYLGQTLVETDAKTILLVEDDELVRTSVSAIVKKHGYLVETATDGMDAFRKIFIHNPRLVIIDKVMPKLGGYDFLFAIRKIPEFRYTPMILITAAATPDEEKQALEKGFFDFIMKPVKEISLMTKIKRAMQFTESIYGMTG